MGEVRDGEAAVVEPDRGLGPGTAEARGSRVEESCDGVGGIVVKGQLVAGAQERGQSDEPRNTRGLSKELVAPGDPEAQGALAGVVADAEDQGGTGLRGPGSEPGRWVAPPSAR